MRAAILTLLTAAVLAAAADSWVPATYAGGGLPTSSPITPGGGEVLLQVKVTAAGAVSEVVPLRVTPPFADALVAVVRGWRFQAAALDKRPVESQVLVAGVFRPPTLNTPTLGEPPRDVRTAAADVAFPTSIVTPLYPPRANFGGTVLVEVQLDATGRVAKALTRISAPGLDEAALDAARKWSFRPPRTSEGLVPSNAYIVFDFPQPVVGGPRVLPPGPTRPTPAVIGPRRQP